MSATLLGLPRELRDMIYPHSLCTRDAKIMQRVHLDSFKDEIRFFKAVEPQYPPASNEDMGPYGEAPYRHVEPAGGMAYDEWKETMIRLKPAIKWPNEDGLIEDADGTTNVDDYDDGRNPEEEDSGEDYTIRKARCLRSGRGDAVKVAPPFSLAILRVNQQIRDEALPIVFQQIRFVLDIDAAAAMRFCRSLPQMAFNNVTTMCLTSAALIGDYWPSRRAWTGDILKPRNSVPPIMITPFGALLCSMPKLRHLEMYLPYFGKEDHGFQ